MKITGTMILIAAAGLVAFLLGAQCGRKSRDNEVRELSNLLAESTKTIELTTGLWSKTTSELKITSETLVGKTHEVEALRKQLEKSGQDLLAANQLVLKWKKAYEAAVKGTQTEEPDPTGNVRKRVDFDSKMGLYRVSGHTLTDPPEAFLKLDQVDPLTISVAVAKGKDGKWTSYVASSDPNVDADITLSVVDPAVAGPRWYQRVWVDVGMGFLGDLGGTVGVSYRWDRLSLGAFCGAFDGAGTCGATVGFRAFK